MSKPCKVPSCPALALTDRDVCVIHAAMSPLERHDAMQVTFGMVPPLRCADLGRIEYEKPKESE